MTNFLQTCLMKTKKYVYFNNLVLVTTLTSDF